MARHPRPGLLDAASYSGDNDALHDVFPRYQGEEHDKNNI